MSDEISRTVLPIPDRPYEGGELPLDAKSPEARFPPIQPLHPPTGAPNVLVVLLDDVGFAAASAFGGPCATPTAERLAANGLKYNRFHTTALCAPTRAALLSGRNHHTVGMQKVEGSSPFIRSIETRWKRRVSCCHDARGIGENGLRVSTRVVEGKVSVTLTRASASGTSNDRGLIDRRWGRE